MPLASRRGPAGSTRPGPRRALVALCITEVTSWGVLYYAFPVVISTLTRDTGWSTGAAMGAFSAGAVVSAVAGVWVGRFIDRHGPRGIMTLGSATGVLAVLAIAWAPTLPWFYAAWVLAGLAQAAVLYPPAFTALTRWYGPHRVGALTALTLLGGLASTVFAPLTAALLDVASWRETYVVLAVVLGAVTIPLHALCLTPPWPEAPRPNRYEPTNGNARTVVRGRSFAFLTITMALGAFGMYAATVNLVPLLAERGVSTRLAAIALGLCGAGQVLGRLAYSPFARRTTPRTRTAGVLAAGAVSVLVLGLLPGPVTALIGIAILAGVVRGAHTLVQATAVADRWGTHAFGHINGVFSAPTTALVALAPAAGALLGDLFGGFPTAYTMLAALTLAAATLAIWSTDGPVDSALRAPPHGRRDLRRT
ncbi:MAG: MFS transporter [Streptosporangiales bacterium]|nr:MFS transporter [Streptosporangiales bacterium]